MIQIIRLLLLVKTFGNQFPGVLRTNPTTLTNSMPICSEEVSHRLQEPWQGK